MVCLGGEWCNKQVDGGKITKSSSSNKKTRKPTLPRWNACQLNAHKLLSNKYGFTMKKNALLLDLFLFAGTVALAWYEQWSAKDLVWGLWISSLVLGYSYMLTSIFGGLLRGDMAIIHGKEARHYDPVETGIGITLLNIIIIIAGYSFFGKHKIVLLMILFCILSLLLAIGLILREGKWWAYLLDNMFIRIIIILPTSLFLFGFFSIHFLAFQYIQGSVWHYLFPLNPDHLPGKHINEIHFLNDLLIPSLQNYWLFILASALSRIDAYKTAFQRYGINAVFYPYLNLVRMFIMAIIIGLMSWAGFSSYILYIVLFFYFFPIGIGSFIKDYPKFLKEIEGKDTR